MFLPYIWLIIVAFRNHLLFPYGLTILIGTSVAVGGTLLTLFMLSPHNPFQNWVRPYTVSYVLLWIVLCLVFIKAPPMQILFCLFMVLNYADICTMFYSIVNYFFFESDGSFLYTRHNLAARCVVAVLAYPAMWLSVGRLTRPLIDMEAVSSFWRYLWLVPVSFFFLYRVGVNPYFTSSNFSEKPGESLLPFVWTFGTVLCYSVIQYMLFEITKSAELRERLRVSDIQLSLQAELYESMKQSIGQASRMRHDLRHHLLALKGYVSAEDTAGMDRYLTECLHDTELEEQPGLCENLAIDAVLRHYYAIAKKEGIQTELVLALPPEPAIPESDLCIVLGNLVENALNACLRQTDGVRFFSVKADAMESGMITVMVKNSYSGEIACKGGSFLSSKHGGTGIGTESVKKVAEQYHGITKFVYQDGVFEASVFLSCPES